MATDKLIFDLSNEIEATPNVFVKKDWLNILDNMNGNYNGNQSIIDTSQLSNSNKYMSYREAYMLIPLTLTLAGGTGADPAFGTAATSGDYAIGLKNWFGSIIHSFTCDYNGTTIIQQTPYANMWNSFKLLTSLSWNDVNTQGATIGFFPDDPSSWTYNPVATLNGIGVCNNTNKLDFTPVSGSFNSFNSGKGNSGFLKRQQNINFDLNGVCGGAPYQALITSTNLNNLWKSYISSQQYEAGNNSVLQIAITAIVYLKHIHSFFQQVPLLKGVFMKMTMNLNNCNVTLAGSYVNTSPAIETLSVTSVSVPVGGVCPILIASAETNNGSAACLISEGNVTAATYYANLSVGANILNGGTNFPGNPSTPLSRNIYLYVPAYTFNPVFEQAYLSSPVKQINYTDIYQYQVLNVQPNTIFNQLITNGIAGIKSVLIIPFIAQAENPTGCGVPEFQSPFDPAGCGPTAPLALLTNFNVVVSGQNSIYNTQRYAFEEFNNQLYGCNAVNGGQTDGLTSGLIDNFAFNMEYCYYYVNVSRMLPVEESVPKSVQIVGNNQSQKALDLWVFIEYDCDVSIDILTGSRV